LQGLLVPAAAAVVEQPDERPDVSQCLGYIAQEVVSAGVQQLALLCSCALDVLTAQEGLEQPELELLEALLEGLLEGFGAYQEQ
jgi:hypothetical protein